MFAELTYPTPGVAVVTLSSDNAAAAVPANVTVAEGSTTATFTVNTSAVGAQVSATISGTYNGTQSATLTVNPPTLSSVSVNPTSVTGGTSSTGTVTLGSAAPAGGAAPSSFLHSPSSTSFVFYPDPRQRVQIWAGRSGGGIRATGGAPLRWSVVPLR